MALRALMKRRELDRANAELAKLRETMAGLETREAELAQMIEETETEEERTAVEEEVETFETEKAETAAGIADLEARVAGIETELEEIEAATVTPEPGAEPSPAEPTTTRGDFVNMSKRNAFRSMDMQTRAAMFEREDVRDFIETVRTALSEKRAINGAGLLVPEVFLGVIRENIQNYSKLYKHVNVRQIGGNGTVVVMGTIPEAVWTDCCATLNELDLTFNDAEVACWKVGGYFDICNATIEDSAIDLASEVVTTLGQAIGLALDKAILFGLGTRMPMGIFTRLAQTAAPADYPATARTWADLHTTNIKSIAASVKGVDLFREFLTDTGAAKGRYSNGVKVWTMNEATYTALVATAMTIDAGGAIVSGVNGTMPVIGGAIEILDFIPDNVIIGGYMDLYLLAERAGTRLEQSEHVRFIEDRTVFKGTARYDGLPVIAEGFVAIGINGTTPSASGVTFTPDTANTESE